MQNSHTQENFLLWALIDSLSGLSLSHTLSLFSLTLPLSLLSHLVRLLISLLQPVWVNYLGSGRPQAGP